MSSRSAKISILVLWVLELGMISFLQCNLVDLIHNQSCTNFWNPILFFCLSLAIPLLPFWIKQEQKLVSYAPVQSDPSIILIGAFAILINIPQLIEIFTKYPPTLAHSDIIPQIEVMVHRFFYEGTTPYTPITEFGYEIFSPYMPMHWGPFIISDLFNFDYRWLAISIFFLASLVYLVFLSRQPIPLPYQLILALLPALFLFFSGYTYDFILGHTIEPLIIAYYLLLGLALMSSNPYLKALALLLCLLSRYSIAFWLPLLGIVWILSEPRSDWVKIALLSFAGMFLMYVLPFLIPDPSILEKGLAHHQFNTDRSWTYEPWYNEQELPQILSWGMGLGLYFFEAFKAAPAQGLAAIEYTQLIASLLLVAGLLGFYLWKRKTLDARYFLLLSLKLYLAVFYHLNAVPFPYYFTTLLILSPVIVVLVIADRPLFRSPTPVPSKIER